MMKNKFTLIMLVALTVVGISSCSKETIDSAGRDTVRNIIRANKWFDVVKTVEVEDASTQTIVLVGEEEGDNLEFKSDGYAYIYRSGGLVDDGIPYELTAQKVMLFDGVEYQIQENIIQSITRFTLVREDAGIKTTIAFRRRQ